MLDLIYRTPLACLGFDQQRELPDGVRVTSRSIPPQRGVNSISFGPPHARRVGRTCSEPNEIKENTHPDDITALPRGQVVRHAHLPLGALRLGHRLRREHRIPRRQLHVRFINAL